jgi:hypothetical protein
VQYGNARPLAKGARMVKQSAHPMPQALFEDGKVSLTLNEAPSALKNQKKSALHV